MKKEALNKETVYLEKYDIQVKPYLTYAQIQAIVDAVSSFDSWAERQQNIDMGVLLFVTDIGQEELEAIGHEELYTSGLVDAVVEKVENYYLIQEALDYTFSFTHLINKFTKAYPQYAEKLTEMINEAKNGKQEKK